MPQQAFQRLNSIRKTRTDNQAIRENPGLTKTPEKLPSYISEQNKTIKQYAQKDKEAIRRSPYLKYMPNRLPSTLAKNKTNKKG